MVELVNEQAEASAQKPPRSIPAKSRQEKPTTVVQVEPEIIVEEPEAQGSVAKRQVVSEGEVFEVEMENIDGWNVVKESVYREEYLPNSKRKTKIVVIAKGSRLN